MAGQGVVAKLGFRPDTCPNTVFAVCVRGATACSMHAPARCDALGLRCTGVRAETDCISTASGGARTLQLGVRFKPVEQDDRRRDGGEEVDGGKEVDGHPFRLRRRVHLPATSWTTSCHASRLSHNRARERGNHPEADGPLANLLPVGLARAHWPRQFLRRAGLQPAGIP